MPSTNVLRIVLATTVTLAAVAIAIGTRTPSEGLQESDLAAERFAVVTSPDGLPRSIRVALAGAIGQTTLHMAAAGRPFNASDVVVDNSLPYHRLVCAAVGPKHAIVQFEEGGFAPQLHTIVILRGFWRSYPVWSGQGVAIRDPLDFAAAIKSGTLWAGSAEREPAR